MSNISDVLKAAENQAVTLAEQNISYITIDGVSREIDVPAEEELFGVEGDKDVERKYFQCPKIVGENIDLSQHSIYIAYVLVQSEDVSVFPEASGLYHCDDVQVSGDNITFSWLLSGNVLQEPGVIAFKVMAKKLEGEELKTKWNTVPAFGAILTTVPDGEDIAEQYPDVIEQIFEKLDELEQGGGGVSDYNDLTNKPTLNGIEISGTKTASDYDLQPANFVINVTYEQEEYKADKTFEEINAAYEAGKSLYVTYMGNSLFNFRGKGSNNTGEYFMFSFSDAPMFEENIIYIYSNGKVSVDRSQPNYARDMSGGIIKAFVNDETADEDAVEEDVPKNTIPLRIFGHGFSSIGLEGQGYVEAQKPDFIITVTQGEDGAYTPDRTFEETKNAWDAGMNVYVHLKQSGEAEAKIELYSYSDGLFIFILSTVSNMLDMQIVFYENNKIEVNILQAPYASSTRAGIVLAENKVVNEGIYNAAQKVYISDFGGMVEKGHLFIDTRESNLVITVTNQDGTYVSNMNAKEIYEAYQAGRTCYVMYGSIRYDVDSIDVNDNLGNTLYICNFKNTDINGVNNISISYNEGEKTGTVTVNREDYKSFLQTKDLVVHIKQQDGAYTANYSVQDIIDAYNHDINCYLDFQGTRYSVQYIREDSVFFGNVYGLTIDMFMGDSHSNSWERSLELVTAGSNRVGGVKAYEFSSYDVQSDTVPVGIDVYDNFLYVPEYAVNVLYGGDSEDNAVDIWSVDDGVYTMNGYFSTSQGNISDFSGSLCILKTVEIGQQQSKSIIVISGLDGEIEYYNNNGEEETINVTELAGKEDELVRVKPFNLNNAMLFNGQIQEVSQPINANITISLNITSDRAPSTARIWRAYLVFSVGESPVTFTVNETDYGTVHFVGKDCEDGVFTPQANSGYYVEFYTCFSGVRAYVREN